MFDPNLIGKTQSKVGSEDFYKNDMTSHNIGSHIGNIKFS